MINLVKIFMILFAIEANANLPDHAILAKIFNAEGFQGFIKEGAANDLAIAGDGLFPLRDEKGEIYFSRRGTFKLSSDDRLIHKLSGFEFVTMDADGKLGPIILKGKGIKPFPNNPKRMASLTVCRVNKSGELEGAYTSGETEIIGQFYFAILDDVSKLNLFDIKKHLLKYNKAAGKIYYTKPSEHSGLLYDKSIEVMDKEYYKANFDK